MVSQANREPQQQLKLMEARELPSRRVLRAGGYEGCRWIGRYMASRLPHRVAVGAIDSQIVPTALPQLRLADKARETRKSSVALRATTMMPSLGLLAHVDDTNSDRTQPPSPVRRTCGHTNPIFLCGIPSTSILMTNSAGAGRCHY